MKNFLASLALALALTAALTFPAAAFDDVAPEKYYSAAIDWAVQRGITSGTTETTFSPDAPCTRGQILTFVWRAAGSPAPGPDTSLSFTDVPESAYYCQPVLWALEQGILEGGETLCPDTPCTRSEAALYLWRSAGSPEPGRTAAFSDVPPEADWAPAISWAVETGVTEGSSETTFSPDAPCTRGQIAVFLHRCLEQPVDSDPDALSERQPLQTLNREGSASSLGLDGSEFSSRSTYDAEVRIDIYSPTEAAFTITVPFPLFQAWDYAVRFDEEDSGVSYVFSYLRWDEAFADLVNWPEAQDHCYLEEMTNTPQNFSLKALDVKDDRMGGVISWRVLLPEESGFRFDDIEGYAISCDVASTSLPWAPVEPQD